MLQCLILLLLCATAYQTETVAQEWKCPSDCTGKVKPITCLSSSCTAFLFDEVEYKQCLQKGTKNGSPIQTVTASCLEAELFPRRTTNTISAPQDVLPRRDFYISTKQGVTIADEKHLTYYEVNEGEDCSKKNILQENTNRDLAGLVTLRKTNNATSSCAVHGAIAVVKTEQENAIRDQISNHTLLFMSSQVFIELKEKLMIEGITFTIHTRAPTFTNATTLPPSIMDDSNVKCAYYEHLTKQWITKGCSVKMEHNGSVTCTCYHLSSYAVMFDYTGFLHDKLASQLNKITAPCTVASVVASIITALIFVSFKKLHSTMATVHVSLCLHLIAFQVSFLLGIKTTEEVELCRFISFLLEFVFTNVLICCSIEAFTLMLILGGLIAQHTNACIFSFIINSLIFAVSGIVTFITLLLGPKSTENMVVCWIAQAGEPNYVFLISTGLILAANTVALTVVIIRLNPKQKTDAPVRPTKNWLADITSETSEARRTTTDVVTSESPPSKKVGIGTVLCLGILFGLLWVIGFIPFSWDQTKMLPFVFTTVNALQGVFVFIILILANEAVWIVFIDAFKK